MPISGGNFIGKYIGYKDNNNKLYITGSNALAPDYHGGTLELYGDNYEVEDRRGGFNLFTANNSVAAAALRGLPDGTLTWNNNPILTDKQLGYRQSATSYTVGQIAYHSSLPTGWYLECTTAGTSGSSELVISSPSIGDTVSDGTVTWTVRQTSTRGLDGFKSGNIITITNSATLRAANDNAIIDIVAGPDRASSPRFAVYGVNYSGTSAGKFYAYAMDGTNQTALSGAPNGSLSWNNNDLAGAAIVEKSLGTTGYIKYASKLIFQWGSVSVAINNTYGYVALPINFPTAYFTITGNINYTEHYEIARPVSIEVQNLSRVKVAINPLISTGGVYVNYIAIGY